MDEIKCTKHHTRVFYYFLTRIIDGGNEYDLFCEYWLAMRKRPVRPFLASLFAQVAHILRYGAQDSNHYQLPDILCQEPWRAQKLLLNILKQRMPCISVIINEICSCAWVPIDDQEDRNV